MRNLFLFYLILIAVTSQGQNVGKPERFAKTITVADLQNHLSIIASAEMEGRETATEGQRKAAAYIENAFQKLGLQPGANGSYQQPFTIYQDTLLDARLEVDGQAFTLNQDFSPFTGSYNATMAFSEVVFIPPHANADSIKKSNLAGKLALVLPENARSILQLLQGTGIAAVLWVAPSNVVAKLQPRQTQSLHQFRSNLPTQLFTISPVVARAVLKMDPDSAKQLIAVKTYKANVLLDVKKETKNPPMQSTNVIGVLPGTDLKDEYLVITAHYDHLGKRDSVIYYGADDDGSGTVAVLEMAEAFVQAKKRGQGPRRSIVFMAVSGEEKGLWGSEYYGDHPLFPLERTTANLNIDMIGRSDTAREGDTTNYVYVVGDDKISSELKPINETANRKYTKLELDYKFNDPADRNQIYYRSDHYNFAKKGVPIIFYYDGMLGGDYHKPTDTPDKINYPLLAKRAQLVFYTAWDIVNRPLLLKRDRPLPVLSR